jgi:hypothetical protein
MSRSRQETERLQTLTSKRWGPRARWVCVYCGRPANQVDHFYPISQTGTNDAFNLVPACDRCNRSKQDHEPMEWMEAVGVPPARANLLWQMYYFLGAPWYLLRRGDIELPRITLDYEPAKALERPKRPIQGA